MNMLEEKLGAFNAKVLSFPYLAYMGTTTHLDMDREVDRICVHNVYAVSERVTDSWREQSPLDP